MSLKLKKRHAGLSKKLPVVKLYTGLRILHHIHKIEHCSTAPPRVIWEFVRGIGTESESGYLVKRLQELPLGSANIFTCAFMLVRVN